MERWVLIARLKLVHPASRHAVETALPSPEFVLITHPSMFDDNGA